MSETENERPHLVVNNVSRPLEPVQKRSAPRFGSSRDFLRDPVEGVTAGNFVRHSRCSANGDTVPLSALEKKLIQELFAGYVTHRARTDTNSAQFQEQDRLILADCNGWPQPFPLCEQVVRHIFTYRLNLHPYQTHIFADENVVRVSIPRLLFDDRYDQILKLVQLSQVDDLSREATP